jgi:rare lipoprotein A (peptidoglycan hydrolase)
LTRLQLRPASGRRKLTSTASRRRRGGRIAGIAVSMALLTFGAGSAFAQNGGGFAAPTDPTAPPPTTTATPVPSGNSWTATQKATWYGPGLWGRSTACGQVLTPMVIGVANKNLPCGTNVTFTYGTRSVTATVIDRGPYRKGYAWDLTKKAAKRLGFLAVGAGRVTATVTLPAP